MWAEFITTELNWTRTETAFSKYLPLLATILASHGLQINFDFRSLEYPIWTKFYILESFLFVFKTSALAWYMKYVNPILCFAGMTDHHRHQTDLTLKVKIINPDFRLLPEYYTIMVKL